MNRYLTVLVLGLFAFGESPAAPLQLNNVPIFLGTTAEPNIMFVIDDSGSMDWEIMSRDFDNGGRFTGSQTDGSNPSGSGDVTHRDADENGVADCGFGANGQTFFGYIYGVEFARNVYADNASDCNSADDQAWRFRNYQFNPHYFNPNRTYEPWPGVDAAGNAFQDMPVTAALADPFDPNSEIIDLTRHNSDWGGGTVRRSGDRDNDGIPDGFRYYLWQDNNGNGLFDNGEQTEYLVKNADAPTRQNFANWFSYYRSRHLAAKAAYGKIIATAENVRMGMVTLHNNNNVNTTAKIMNSDPATGNKRALLDALYAIRPGGSTPLRRTFYESCRYLGCKNNNLFSSCPRLEEKDGGACQQNFLVLMTDGFYNGGFSGLGNKDGDYNSIFDGGAFADIYHNTLADIAMHFYENDLHPDITNNVPVLAGIDNADHQHIVTYTVAFGVEGGLSATPTDPASPFVWPNPSDNDSAKIDDLLHAAYNGRGKKLAASSPQQLINSLNETISDIGERTSAASAVALNSASLRTDSLLYQARFDSGNWSGQLLYYPIGAGGAVSAPSMDAGDILESQSPAERTIVTWHAADRRGIPFEWSSLSTAQQNALDIDPDTGGDDNEGPARLDYLRGSSEHEGKNNRYRDRSRVLGDIIHSTPLYVGAPVSGYLDSFESSAYTDFKNAHASRRGVVYVGANDGMLHGFDGQNGKEVLAYVPGSVYADLNKLTSVNYSHRYFVDGSPASADIHLNGLGWRTVLVAGLRSGGKAFFALDITDPALFKSANAASIALWEFNANDDPDLGYAYSDPAMVKLANGQWGVVVGNGYNSCSSLPRLFIINAATGALITKLGTDGSNYAQTPWTTPACSSSAQNPDGLASPAVVDVDGDRVADFAYAGDLNGNLWRFDLRDGSAAQWHVSFGQPMFTATDAFGRGQPVTTRPMVGFHPDFPHVPGFMVYFGTGKYLEPADNETAGVQTQSFYAVWDRNETTLDAFTRSDLLQQKILAEVSLGDGRSARVTSDPVDGSQYQIDWARHRGWYMDLINTQGGNTDNQGERQVTHAVLKLDRIIFTTLIPNTEQCGFGGGGWLMELDARDGSRLDFSIFDVNNDGAFSSEDEADVATSLLGGAGGGTSSVPVSGLGGSDSGIPSAPSFIGIPPRPEDRDADDSPTPPDSTTPPTIKDGWSQRHHQTGEVEERVFMSDSKGRVPSYLQNDALNRIGRINWQQLR